MNDTLLTGDALTMLRTLPDASVQVCVTSPPYWGLRDYGMAGQLGAEKLPSEYVGRLVAIFVEVRRVLRDDGTFWLNIGDSYTSGNRTWRDPDKKNHARGMSERATTPPGLRPKNLVGIPWRVAFALQDDGWNLRSDIVWAKPNPMPESVSDRPTRSHEFIFLFTKSLRYFYDAAAIAEPVTRGYAGSTFTSGKTAKAGLSRTSKKPREEKATRNARSVWTRASAPLYPGRKPNGGRCTRPVCGIRYHARRSKVAWAILCRDRSEPRLQIARGAKGPGGRMNRISVGKTK